MLHDSCDLLICQVALVSSNGMAEPECATDALQCSLRSRFQARPTPGVRAPEPPEYAAYAEP
jgi:hypothetical protein